MRTLRSIMFVAFFCIGACGGGSGSGGDGGGATGGTSGSGATSGAGGGGASGASGSGGIGGAGGTSCTGGEFPDGGASDATMNQFASLEGNFGPIRVFCGGTELGRTALSLELRRLATADAYELVATANDNPNCSARYYYRLQVTSATTFASTFVCSNVTLFTPENHCYFEAASAMTTGTLQADASSVILESRAGIVFCGALSERIEMTR